MVLSKSSSLKAISVKRRYAVLSEIFLSVAVRGKSGKKRLTQHPFVQHAQIADLHSLD